ncbi:MAG: ABC transporter ATP-binding protein [Candidatus Marinimicrobia bacterium]|jgi:putative ABC transport system ATP-binding protein|nr:ABC transporter ATP-binding protein [Candidatus Neomarinimicrobiota bacterium]MBT4069360.1 ABC transporter ATP-binding protein [Candidatus Neomarinimicrobiota bacterium]MBT4308735.1 ABC transporter ATP-binding protein [Candidatus Neomarinimicrobiota bacterium]MBT4809803.1 ABC transporter ATP-binding protein [Candidatus Neomarinimicrobiota bacterium]MBT5175633.1 ABC transporter ATP-binding protein [Candidatus Neomarinimicrobiota bacterium]
MGNNAVITINNLVKRFPVGGDFFTALKDIDLTINKGEFTGLIGPSGSGKTTLLNIIGGLDSPTEGQVSVLGQALNDTSHGERARLRRKHMGFIFQSYNLLPVYTVFENVELPLILNKIDPQERNKKVAQAIEWVGLSDKRDSRPAMLSGGECQRTAIARAIVHQPALVLADEPTANLDAENSHHIMKILVRLNKELSTSFIFATHDEKIMAYLRRIIHLDDGEITEDEKIENPKAS